MNFLKLFLGFLFLLKLSPGESKILTLRELDEEYKKISQGSILSHHHGELKFKLNPKDQTITPLNESPSTEMRQSLFEIDVEKFNQVSLSQDFLTAKKKFYQKLKWNPRLQEFSRPYPYLTDWKSLFHPPIKKLKLPLEVYGEQFKALDPDSLKESPLLDRKFQVHLDQLTETEMTAGNRLRLLSNGQNSFREKIRMVRETKKFFYAVVMVQYCDQSGSEMVRALTERAHAGVDVRLILEGAWTQLLFKKCLKKLREGGVKVTLGRGFLNPQTLFTVHHSKFWIRDGEEAIMGGQNMHDFENLSDGFNQHTRDKDVHVRGPAVTDMMKAFVHLWNQEQKNSRNLMVSQSQGLEMRENHERELGLRGARFYSDWLHKDDLHKVSGICRVLVQGTKNSGHENIISKAYLEIMKKVKHQMLINTLSFHFDQKESDPFSNSQVIKAMIESSRKGVKIDLITNGLDAGFGEAGFQLRQKAKKLMASGNVIQAQMLLQLEKELAPLTGRIQSKNIARAFKDTNIDVWFYFNHIHSKQMVFDQILTSTGSFNLDAHSHRNHESTILCLDEEFAQESLRGFTLDLINSTPALSFREKNKIHD